jgi:zinc transporter, ZIP family
MVENYNSSLESFLLTILVSVIVASPFLIASILSKGSKHPTRLKADLASFSVGIFLGAVTFSIIEESVELGDILTMGVGFGIGSATFSIIRYIVQKNDKIQVSNKIIIKDEDENNLNSTDNSYNNTNRKKGAKEGSTKTCNGGDGGGSGQIVILGTLLDSHPETIMIGIIIRNVWTCAYCIGIVYRKFYCHSCRY